MVSALTTTATGAIFKLESVTGTLLGSVVIPAAWADRLIYRSVVQFPAGVMTLLCARPGSDIRIAMLALSSGRYGESLVLYGMTLEEFERLPGCSFMPGANYLRSLLD